MPNLRIIADNAADRATLTASSTAGALTAASLQTDIKSDVWRATGASARIGAAWTTSELIGAMFMPYCNLTSAATVRVRASNEAAATNLLTYSERLDNAVWNKLLGGAALAPTVIANYTAAPDGSMTAARVKFNLNGAVTSGDVSYLNQFIGAPFAGGTGSVWLKTNDGTTKAIWLRCSANQVQVSVTAVWQRFSIYEAGSGVDRLQLAIYGNSGPQTADLAVWGCMVAAGPLSSYYPSVDAFVSRASPATFIGSNGLMQTSINGVRMQHNPLNLSAPAKLLLEPAASNLFQYSGSLSNAAWVKTSTTITPAAAVAPDGTMTMEMLTGINTITSYAYQIVAGLAPSTNYAMSMYLRKGTSLASLLRVFESSLSTLIARCQIDWSAQGVPTISYLAGAWATSPYVQDMGGGLYRITGAVNSAALTSLAVLLYPDSANGVGTVYATAFQFQSGLFSDSYIATTLAAATRSADVSTSAPGARPAGYIDTWQSYDYDSGTVVACPGGGANLRAWGNTPLGANAYGYGGGACARVWLPSQIQAISLAVDISDPSNPAGHVEAARLVAGSYWEPAYNADYGAPVTPVDASKNFRNDAGDLMTDLGTKSRKQSISLSNMSAADRARLWDIVYGNGMAIPMMFSLYPNDADGKLERTHQMFCKLVSPSAMATPSYARYSNSLELEEV
ncbi:hypothetical protein AAKU55_003136 [Oxalobacteraceae bacterium GrIS 1.11]